MKPELNDSTSSSGSGETPETDALFNRHVKETDLLLSGLSTERGTQHSFRQAKELLDHARSLERRLAQAESLNDLNCRLGERLEAEQREVKIQREITLRAIERAERAEAALVPPERPTEAEASEEARDAKRYRWLRDNVSNVEDCKGGLWEVVFSGYLPADPPSICPLTDSEQVDAAIDAAMTGEPR